MFELIPNLRPMLFKEKEIFNSKDYIYELKLDGIRCLAYLDGKTILINKRGKDVTEIYPELKEIYKNVKERCILDGELIIMDHGKPNFFKIQKRSLLNDKFKIALLSEREKVTFVAFDILYLKNKLIIDLPLMQRKELLQNTVKESDSLVISRYIEEKGEEFFNLAKENNLEGVVGKLKQSKYYPGKRSNVWFKAKVYEEDDLIICGYTLNEKEKIKDIIFGKIKEDGSIERVVTINTNKDQDIILKYAKNNQTAPLFPYEKEDVIWVKPFLVGKVKYMMKTESGSLRQAIFLGVRDDKTINDLKNEK